MDKISHKKLIDRHKELKQLGKVLFAIEISGLSNQTYYRAINADETIMHDTLMKILSSQKEVLDRVHKEVINA